MTADAAIVNLMNGVGLFPTQAPHFGTKERNKVGLLLSKLAPGIHSGKWVQPGIRGEYTRAINLTGHWVWPRSTQEEAEAVLRGFPLAEFTQTRAGTHTCEYTHNASSLSEGKV